MPTFRQKRQKFTTQSLPKHNKTGEIAVNFSRFSFSDMPKPLKVSPRLVVYSLCPQMSTTKNIHFGDIYNGGISIQTSKFTRCIAKICANSLTNYFHRSII